MWFLLEESFFVISTNGGGERGHNHARAGVGACSVRKRTVPEATVDSTAGPTPHERELLERLRAGDEAAFSELVRMYSPSLLRVALMYVPSRAVAEEVVQETWLGLLNGLDRFEGRSTLKTYLFRILVNRARTRGERERRTVPFASLASQEAGEEFEPVDADRFQGADRDHPGHWATPPRRWETDPERALQSAETVALVKAAIAKLPEAQRTVITLRDLEGWSAEETRNALEISETNQRVLLHRARSKVRTALEEHLAP
jgi:RNA polymerase sigma-70 factor (ECF subfamily)